VCVLFFICYFCLGEGCGAERRAASDRAREDKIKSV